MFDSPALYPRPLVPVLQHALTDTPVVCLTGPRQSGKTTLVRAMMPDRPYFSLDHPPYLSAARADPAGFVAALPREVTIAEIQRAPELLPAIKLSVDLDRRPGRFVLTGSANLLLVPTVTESLAGRMEIARLMPLSEAEKERRPGLLQLSLFDERDLAEISAPELCPGERLVVCRNPLLAAERARKREALLQATEAKLDLVVRATKRENRPLRSEKNIAVRANRQAPTPSPARWPQGRRGVSNRRKQADKLLLPNSKRCFGPRNRPHLPSLVARGFSAPYLTLDPEVHE